MNEKRPGSVKAKTVDRRRNELTGRIQELILQINKCDDAPHRIWYLEQLRSFSGVLLRYESPEAAMAYGMRIKGIASRAESPRDREDGCLPCFERRYLPPPWRSHDILDCVHSRLYYWLCSQRRIALSNRVNKITLHHTHYPSISSLDHIAQQTSIVFSILSDWDVMLPPRRKWKSQRVEPLALFDYYDGQRRLFQRDMAALSKWKQLFPSEVISSSRRSHSLLNGCVVSILEQLDLLSLFGRAAESAFNIDKIELSDEFYTQVHDVLLYEAEAQELEPSSTISTRRRRTLRNEPFEETYPDLYGPYLGEVGVPAAPFVLNAWIHYSGIHAETLVRFHHKIIQEGAANDVNIVGGVTGTALQTTLYSGDDIMIDLLLRNGADINVGGGYWGSPLQATCASGECPLLVKRLLDLGANTNHIGGEHGYPLRAAVWSKNAEMVLELLELGANVMNLDRAMSMPIVAALFHRWDRIAKILAIETIVMPPLTFRGETQGDFA
ncbi:hypothetical protein FRC17_005201 [Serendipita sp. 399]|nr:hypothetical protein FRC17_005201 [Serendipita sp. 399]